MSLELTIPLFPFQGVLRKPVCYVNSERLSYTVAPIQRVSNKRYKYAHFLNRKCKVSGYVNFQPACIHFEFTAVDEI